MKQVHIVTVDEDGRVCKQNRKDGVIHDNVDGGVVNNCLECRYFGECLLQALDYFNAAEDERVLARVSKR